MRVNSYKNERFVDLHEKKKKIFVLLLVMISICISLFIILVFAKAVSYSIPLLSDEMDATLRKRFYYDENGRNMFGAALNEAKFAAAYGGTYFSSFFYGLVLPITKDGFLSVSGIRIQMVLFLIIYFGSIYFAVLSLLKLAKDGIYKNINLEVWSVAIFAMILYLFTSKDCWYHVYYWYTGTMAYTVPMEISLIVIGMTACACKSNKKILYVAAGILGLIVSMSTLCITGLVCYALLILCMMNMRDRYLWGTFGATVIGALISVLCPGNFSRFDLTEPGSMPIVDYFVKSLSDYRDSVRSFFCIPFSAVCFLLILLIGYGMINLDRLKGKLILLLFFIPLPLFAILPVEIGYHGTGQVNRTSYIVDLAVLAVILYVVLLAGGLLRGLLSKIVKEKVKNRYFKSIFSVVFGMLLFLFIVKDYRKISDIISVQTYRELKDGTIMNYTNEVLELCEYFKESNEKKICLDHLPDKIDNFQYFYLTDDPESSMASWVGIYFYKDKIWVATEE